MSPFAGKPQLHIVENVLREVGDLLPDRAQRKGRNDDLELRNQNSIPLRAIPDANIPPARVLLNNVCDVVGWYFAQHFRWELATTHSRNPPKQVLFLWSAFSRNAAALSRKLVDLRAVCKRKSGDISSYNYGVPELKLS